MFTLFKNKSKKTGPLKALSSVFASEEKVSDSGLGNTTNRKPSSSSSPSRPQASTLTSSKKQTSNYASKDDLSMTRSDSHKKKTKVKANPYATVKMWRPITMTSSVSHDEDAYRSFNNFDVLVGSEAKLPATGDLRNEDFLPTAATSNEMALSRTVSNPVTHNEFTAASTNGDGVPPDYHQHPSPVTQTRSGKFTESNGNSEGSKKKVDFRKSAPPGGSDVTVKRTLPSSAVTFPLKSRSLSIEEQRQEGGETKLVPPPRRSRQMSKSFTTSPPASSMNGGTEIPVDYPGDSSSTSSRSQRSRSLSQDSTDSSERRGRSVMESSYTVVSPEVSKSVRAVLSKTYGPEGFEAASQDVETMLARLKSTMENLKTTQATVSSSGSQFQTVRQELQLQTKQFVQDAKFLVAGATGAREAVSQHLHGAMHTLARLFLHSQATMTRMRTVHQAQHVGFEVLKVSASFKSTVAAANAAMGKPTTDPHMKYLMRQATNLAGLLTTLLKTLKTLEQV